MRFAGAFAAAALAATMLADPARAATYPLPPPDEDVIGELGDDVTHEEDTLVDLARRHRLGYEELTQANPTVDRWLPGEGTPVLLPTRYVLPDAPREGIVVNLAEFRLYYYPKAPKRGGKRVVETYAVSAGRDDWKTPEAIRTRVQQRLENPAWYPPKSIREEPARAGEPLPAVVPPGPDNPLGPLALKLAIPGGYFIHGTSKPFGIGMSVTHGCLRLYPEDMRGLFDRVPVGTPVRVVNQPYKTGWSAGVLYFEAHAPGEPGEPRPDDSDLVKEALQRAAARRKGYVLDWDAAMAATADPRGVPMAVLPRDAGG